MDPVLSSAEGAVPAAYTWLWVLGFSVVGSLGGISGTMVFMAFPQKLLSRLMPHLLSYGTGTLLGVAFLGLIPHALEGAPVEDAMLAALAGILIFFALEKIMLWRDCHDPGCETHTHSGNRLVLLGDGIHNFVDGITIGAAFLVSTALGVATSVAVLIHELPQEVGDFAILVDGGYTRKRAFLVNMVISLTTLPGAFMAYFGLSYFDTAIPYMLAIAGASFIYVACGHLLPTLHKRLGILAAIEQVALMAAGVVTIALVHGHNHG